MGLNLSAEQNPAQYVISPTTESKRFEKIPWFYRAFCHSLYVRKWTPIITSSDITRCNQRSSNSPGKIFEQPWFYSAALNPKIISVMSDMEGTTKLTAE